MKKCLSYLFFLGLVLLNNSCGKEYSFENGNAISEGLLQDDGTGECLPKNLVGTYITGTALTSTGNYLEVQVHVLKPGSYTISTDTVNGISFRAAGVFQDTGMVILQLKGKGTPAVTSTNNFLVRYGLSGCTFSITTATSPATFALSGAPGGCTLASPGGTYTVDNPLDSSNTVTINVDVSVAGAYSITTPITNGIHFTGSGIFTTTGPQAIVLNGSGIPAAQGATNVPITAGTSSCSFQVNVL
jgi:hypothetical protein